MSPYFDGLVLLLVLLIGWRVWLLVDALGQLQSAHDRTSSLSESQMGSEDLLLLAHERTDSLARALGYEWKRTDAKEGWERCAVASVKPDAPKNPFSEYLRGALWTEGFGSAIPWTYRPTVADRRKGDRRKPAVRPSGVAAAAEVTRLMNKARAKKPRRAH